ncbi:hypothetical protein M569_02272 [Genlisea aurea]|uniref:AAA+ ATPase domain-containing protein n=1 Tax=Genlisea aurea TaxID=192259 RepID=S8CYH9_9LAMI|nr:hypothetical protein M569_02272 [Genlisea aurea]
MWVLNLLALCVAMVGMAYLFWLFLHRTALIFVVKKWSEGVLNAVHVYQHLRVPELDGLTQRENHFYRRVSLYVNSLPSLEDSDYANLISGKRANDIILSPEGGQPIGDVFLSARLSWVNRIERDDRNRVVSRSFELRIRKKDKRRVLQPYLRHIHAVSGDIEQRGKQLKIHNNVDGEWIPAPFAHPANFETLVLDPEVKAKIKHDLETFVKSEQQYHKLGRLWKRSYLLYGPYGTGKSSFIGAAANLLNYDVYNVNLSQLAGDGDLNTLLLRTTAKSIIAVEDLDLYISEKSKGRVSFSGLLNFMDGIQSSLDGKITIFTMNSKDGIESALLRPGRIDVHIYFPLCDFNSFKNLASNYLGVKEHKLYSQVEEIFQSGATMSPAEISELMLVNRSSPSRALRSVISALRSNSKKSMKSLSRIGETAASSPTTSHLSGAEDGGCIGWKDPTAKDQFRRLYGLLGLKGHKRVGSSGVVDSEFIER